MNALRVPLVLLAATVLIAAVIGILSVSAPVDPPSVVDSAPPKGPELEKWYFARWHEPHGAMLERSHLDALWREVRSLPEETGSARGLGWIPVGPNGIWFPAYSALYSGRVLDLAFRPDGWGLRVAAASGGLWETAFLGQPPVALTEKLTSQAIGSFCTHPTDGNTILVGTGEPELRTGTGLWRTTDSGQSWTSVAMTPEPQAFYRIRYAPGASIVHAATTEGYYRSTDGGGTWTRTLTGVTTDLAIDVTWPNVLYVPVETSGLWRSTDSGASWLQMVGTGLPTSGNGRGAVAVAPTDLDRIYVAFANASDVLLGVYKTTNGGSNWTTISPPENYLGGQGWYNNVVTVSPTNRDFVAVGGVRFWYSTNAGGGWTVNTSAHLHVDHHAFLWKSDGTQLWSGNDGGLAFTNDGAVTWHSQESYLPITQYYNIHVGTDNTAAMAGGSQDNGISITDDGGFNWYYRQGGDGAGVSFDPNDANRMWIAYGPFSDSWTFHRQRSTNQGASWTDINAGLDPSFTVFPEIRNDQVSPVWIYTNSGPHVWESTDYGDTWSKLNPTPFPLPVIRRLTVTRWTPPKAVVYACIASNQDGKRLRVYDNGTWYERSAAFPSSLHVRKVAVHPSDPDKAWALLDGYGAPGDKVFKTTDRGQNWVSVMGNLPDVPVADLVPHPANDNALHLGTELGCFRTTNGGTTWERWNAGLPEAAIVTEMTYYDFTATTGEFWIVAGTYGRGMWAREISTSDLTDAPEVAGGPSAGVLVARNRPNPFRARTTIEFSLPSREHVRLRLFDVAGREVSVLWDGVKEVGVHEVEVDAVRLAPGVYFYRLETARASAAGKMVRLPAR